MTRTNAAVRQEEIPAPCPFCGDSLIEHDRFFRHENNGCILSNFGLYKGELAAWNNRVK